MVKMVCVVMRVRVAEKGSSGSDGSSGCGTGIARARLEVDLSANTRIFVNYLFFINCL